MVKKSYFYQKNYFYYYFFLLYLLTLHSTLVLICTDALEFKKIPLFHKPFRAYVLYMIYHTFFTYLNLIVYQIYEISLSLYMNLHMIFCPPTFWQGRILYGTNLVFIS
jgi:hypothetical protein